MDKFLIFWYVVLLIVSVAMVAIRDDLPDERKMDIIDKIIVGFLVFLLIVLSVGRALADDQTDRQRITNDLFTKKFSTFLEKGTFNIGGKVIFNSGFTQTVNFPDGTAVAIVSVDRYVAGPSYDEKQQKYINVSWTVRLSYLVISRNGIKIDKSAKGDKPFIFDNNNRPLDFKREVRTEITESSPDGIYAFASSQSTQFKNDSFWDNAFILDNFDRVEYNARYSRVYKPTPIDGDDFYHNDRPFVEAKGYKYEVDYQYNAKFVDGLNGKEIINEKALFDVEVDKIISEENAKKHLQEVEGDNQKDKNDSINQDNFGKKGKELEENHKDHKPNSLIDWLEYFVYDEQEVKKAIVSTTSKIESMKGGTERFNGSTFNPANNASYGIWLHTVENLDNANFDENYLTGATALGVGRVPWRDILKYTIRMIGSFAFAVYVMKIKERIVSK